MYRSIFWALTTACLAALASAFSGPSLAALPSTTAEEKTCQEIGFKPKTEEYGSCVMELFTRSGWGAPRTEPISQVPLTPNGQICAGYGFATGTTPFSQCLMGLDATQRQAEAQQQQHQLQMQQYQQQVAAYQAQQAAINKERERQKWASLAILGFGMASSNSPTFAGGLTDGFRALNGQPPMTPPVAPTPPQSIQNYTLRLPSGNQVYCNYNPSNRYMSCD